MALTAPITTYSDTTPQKRQITDYISVLDPSDAPMVDILGGLDGAAGKFRFVNDKSTLVEWLEGTLKSLAAAVGSTTLSSTVTTITMADADGIQEGDILLIDSELVWVSAVDNATEIVTVTRNMGGTQASHASGVTVAIVGQARLEGDDSDDVAATDRTVGSNYTQIFQQEVHVSRSQRQRAQYGIADEFTYQSDLAIPELMRKIERHWYYWQGAAAAGSATTPRIMAGYYTLTTNKVSGASLAQSQFENAVMSAYTAGGADEPLLAFVAPANMQKIKNWYDSSVYLNIQRSETTVGMRILQVTTPFGDVKLIMDRWAKTTEIPIISPSRAGFLTYYPFTFDTLAKLGDSDKGEVVGEFTYCQKNGGAHAVLTAVS